MAADKAAFIRQLAEFLVGDQARKSIEVQMGKPSARAWAALRSASPLHGYLTVDEAITELTAWLHDASDEMRTLRSALRAVLGSQNCCCEFGKGNPMVTEHLPGCRQARAALGVVL